MRLAASCLLPHGLCRRMPTFFVTTPPQVSQGEVQTVVTLEAVSEAELQGAIDALIDLVPEGALVGVTDGTSIGSGSE